MSSIRTKITSAFLVMVVTTAVLVVVIVLVNLGLTNRYKIINENIFYEQSFKENISFLVDDIYKGFNSDDYFAYDGRVEKIKEIEKILDSKMLSPDINNETKISYRSLKNSLDSFFEYIDSSRKTIKENGSIEGISSVFEEASIRLDFVLQNSTNLILSEFKNIASTTQEIQKIQKIALVIISIIIILISCILIAFAILFSKKISDPLIELSQVARNISEGDLNLELNEKMLKGTDEIGSLAKSFSAMLSNLREKIREVENRIKESTKANIDLNNSKSAILNLLQDIDQEKKKVEETVKIRTKELSDEKSRFLASINSLSIGFAIVDTEGKIILNNPALGKVVDSEKPVQTLSDISLKIETEINLLRKLQDCTKERCVIDIKEVLSGSKYLRIFLTPVFSSDKDKLPLGGAILIEDITESVILARSKDEFFAVASHELRTPLTAIRGNTEMILDDYADKINDKDVKEMLSDIKEASTRLIGIVNDFLDVSRLEQGKVVFEKEKFDVVEIIENVVKMLHGGAEGKKLVLNFIKPESPIFVMADKGKVEQITTNLIGNAIKFTIKGSVTVQVEMRSGFISIKVVDTGSGISAKSEALLFRKFQPAGDSVLARDVTKSTGLGLYISQLLVSKMGGTIGLEKSKVDEGSVFFFTLPTA